MEQTLEVRARSQCAVDIAAAKSPPNDAEAAIERYWPVVAVEIAGGNTESSTGTSLPEDFCDRAKEYEILCNF